MNEKNIQLEIEKIIKRIDLLRRATAAQADGRLPYRIDSLRDLDEVFPKHYYLSFGISPDDNIRTEFTLGVQTGCRIVKHFWKMPFVKNYVCPIEGGIYTLRDTGISSMEYRIQQYTPDVAIYRSTYQHLAEPEKSGILTAIRSGDIDPVKKEAWRDLSSKIEEPTVKDVEQLKTGLDECEPWAREVLGIEKHERTVCYLLPKTAFYAPEVRKEK